MNLPPDPAAAPGDRRDGAIREARVVASAATLEQVQARGAVATAATKHTKAAARNESGAGNQ
jgi:hypothetical protein